MTHPTRRGFLSLLAHLPIVGVLFRGRGFSLERYHETVEENRSLLRLIRWVPVTERLPESMSKDTYCSVRLMTLSRYGTIDLSFLQKNEHSRYEESRVLHWMIGDEGFCEPIDYVTHWAELPAPPTPAGTT